MADKRDSLDARDNTEPDERTKRNRADRGLGPFSGRQLTTIVCVAIIAAVAGLPMVASAVIPNAKGVYNACVNKKSGAVRLIDPSKKQHCNKTKEKSVSWNKAGKQGPAGSARAYAYVQHTGNVVPARTKNIAAKLGATGLYCIDVQGGIDPASVAPVATAELGDVNVLLTSAESICGAGNDFIVRPVSGNTYVNMSFALAIP
jgi:hypothetical protein